jgi:hypothetical protein
MSLISEKSVANAESSFRLAFERLKNNCPQNIPIGSQVTQNNIAKEAGCDPSAFRKSRYPELIAEVKHWISENVQEAPSSPRKTLLAQRRNNRSLREQIIALKAERDIALSILLEADSKILELTQENLRLARMLPDTNVTPILSGSNDKH